ncbi:hypothetical protein A3SI_09123 [Nitritalea halalkaliphila LW7]|uniref:Uncharacterized protein n=1 Tax=Nitritalea halalkaliphila LW7 TaxID=1189621 RepID=I5C465_9BACT|nr:hypothetical protein A3SI_09123 [Nitritalea halalkaliphila LW7]
MVVAVTAYGMATFEARCFPLKV